MGQTKGRATTSGSVAAQRIYWQGEQPATGLLASPGTAGHAGRFKFAVAQPSKFTGGSIAEQNLLKGCGPQLSERRQQIKQESLVHDP